MGFPATTRLNTATAAVATTWAILKAASRPVHAEIAPFRTTMAPAIDATATAAISIVLVFALTYAAIWLSLGASSFRIGSSAAPSVSFSSLTWRLNILNWPAEVPAASAAAPPVTRASSAFIFVRSPDLIAASLRPGMSLASAPPLPAYAFASALETASRLLPLAADTSTAMVSPVCASDRSPVAVASFARAGRSSSSATPVASDSCVM